MMLQLLMTTVNAHAVMYIQYVCVRMSCMQSGKTQRQTLSTSQADQPVDVGPCELAFLGAVLHENNLLAPS